MPSTRQLRSRLPEHPRLGAAFRHRHSDAPRRHSDPSPDFQQPLRGCSVGWFAASPPPATARSGSAPRPPPDASCPAPAMVSAAQTPPSPAGVPARRSSRRGCGAGSGTPSSVGRGAPAGGARPVQSARRCRRGESMASCHLGTGLRPQAGDPGSGRELQHWGSCRRTVSRRGARHGVRGKRLPQVNTDFRSGNDLPGWRGDAAVLLPVSAGKFPGGSLRKRQRCSCCILSCESGRMLRPHSI